MSYVVAVIVIALMVLFALMSIVRVLVRAWDEEQIAVRIDYYVREQTGQDEYPAHRM